MKIVLFYWKEISKGRAFPSACGCVETEHGNSQCLECFGREEVYTNIGQGAIKLKLIHLNEFPQPGVGTITTVTASPLRAVWCFPQAGGGPIPSTPRGPVTRQELVFR